MMQAHAGQITGRLTDWHRMMEDLYESGEEDGLVTRQIDGAMFAIRTGQLTRSDYIDITGVSPVTASRDLAMLVKKGLQRNKIFTFSNVFQTDHIKITLTGKVSVFV